jgi:hypothetical protein
VASGGFGLPVHFSVEDRITYDASAHCLYEVDNPVESFQFKYGLRFEDIPETAWNLLPLSFMVDRVVDISAFWRSVTNLSNPSTHFLAGSTRVKYTHERFISAYDIEPGGWGVITLGPDMNYHKSFIYDRVLWSPSFVDTIPTLDLKGLVNSATKITDLSALIVQFLR